jgi:predicted transposase/invertase (TIGR01784 family)
MVRFLSHPFIPKALRIKARQYAAQGKTLSLLNDSVFKAVFSSDSPDSRDALISLLSACTRRPVSHVKLLNNELLPEYLTGKTIRLDVHATFNAGEQADLEMQMDTSADDLKARSSLYAARLLSSQAGKGQGYHELKRVYQIFFVNGKLFPQSQKFPYRFIMAEEETGERLNELVEIIFYELPKMEGHVRKYMEKEKIKKEIKTLPGEEKWCIYMKYRHKAEAGRMIEAICEGEEGIMKAERALEKVSRNEERWARALFREKAEMDYRSELSANKKQGRAEGLAEGLTKGHAEGLAKGQTQGLAKGRQEILTLLKKGKSPEEILKKFHTDS